MRVDVAGTALVSSPDGEAPGLDLHRLRRMDRYGRIGFLSGHLALVSSGVPVPAVPDPRAGLVLGTTFGCRDSITGHAALTAGRGELSPGLFAQTVHNTVNGELAIQWRLGGVSEAIVSGPTAGLEAILLAARRVEEGEADLVVAGGAEGWNDAMRRAVAPPEPVEAGAMLVLVPARAAGAVRVAGGTTFFEPDDGAVAGRVNAWLAGRAERVVTARPELYAASGPAAAIELVDVLRAGEAASGAVVARDPEGPVAVLLLSV